jgi:excinuclease ABC subunit C
MAARRARTGSGSGVGVCDKTALGIFAIGKRRTYRDPPNGARDRSTPFGIDKRSALVESAQGGDSCSDLARPSTPPGSIRYACPMSEEQPRAPGFKPVDAAGEGGPDTASGNGSSSTRLQEGEIEPARLTIAEILDRLPTDPGVYLMKDRRGKAVYIGKAGNLRGRVRQYFQPASGDSRLFVPLLEGIVADIETVVTTNEKEALLLENTLIKRHQPRFNVNLRDDKNYLVLRLDPEANWPRLEVVRKIADDGAFYFGPYHSATSCREALRVVNRHFQLRTCTDHVLGNRRRPCLQYQIQRCPAPCVLPVSRDDYADQVRDVRLFLEGKDDELVARLSGRMKEAATRTQFEQAAAIRDQLRALEVTLQAQKVVSAEFVDQDIIGFHREGMALEMVVMAIRQGKLVGSRGFSFGGQEFPDGELLSSFIGLFYDSAVASIPDEILLPLPIDDAPLKAEWLTDRRAGRRRVEVLVPQRGDRKRLSDLAQRNAQVSFSTRRDAREDVEIMLAKLQRKLRLPKLPRVIECYDISHIQGFAPVASMVVFVDGRPDRSRYRTYRVRGAAGEGKAKGPTARGGNDDFASMYEVLSRRFRRAREGDAGWELPDLVVIDGGKGQLGMALAAARDVGIDVRPGQGLPLVGLAKERDVVSAPDSAPVAETAPIPSTPASTLEPPDRLHRKAVARRSESETRRPDRIYLPHAKDAIPIRPSSAEMFVLQHLRDEAHRFAIGFHRRRRSSLTLRSALADVPGIGPQRQRLLLRQFGSLKKIRDATVDELTAVQGMTAKAAAAVVRHLGSEGGDSREEQVTPIGLPADPQVGSPLDLNADTGARSTFPDDAEEEALESAFAEVEEDLEGEGDAIASGRADS